MSPARLILPPSRTLLRRSDGSLQVGLDTGFVLPHAPPGAEDVLRALRSPRTIRELRALVPTAADWFCEHAPALLAAGVVKEQAQPERPGRAHVVGEGPVGDLVASLLTASGVRVGRREPHDACHLVVWCPSTIEPDRALAQRWAADGQVVLPVRTEPERSVVGPFATGAAGPCITCTDLVRRDLDGDWPHLLAQLCRTRHVPGAMAASWAASVAVAHALSWLGGGTPESVGRSIELESDTGRVGSRRWPQHPDCVCALRG